MAPAAAAAAANTSDQTTLALRDLEEYLGRVLQEVEGSSGTKTLQRLGQLKHNHNAQSGPTQASTQKPDGAKKFLRDLEELIQCFLATDPSSATVPPNVRDNQPRVPPQVNNGLSPGTASRVEVLSRAVEAVEADAAEKELAPVRAKSARPQPNISTGPAHPPMANLRNSNLLQQIDQHWEATVEENQALRAELAKQNEQSQLSSQPDPSANNQIPLVQENQALRSQLKGASRQQFQLQLAKASAEQLLSEKVALLDEIRHAIAELRKELAGHKHTLKKGQAASSSAAFLRQEKEAYLQKVKTSIAQLEGQLGRLSQEKQALDAHHLRTQQILQDQQSLQHTLENSFQTAETEVEALQKLLQQIGHEPMAQPPTTTDLARLQKLLQYTEEGARIGMPTNSTTVMRTEEVQVEGVAPPATFQPNPTVPRDDLIVPFPSRPNSSVPHSSAFQQPSASVFQPQKAANKYPLRNQIRVETVDSEPRLGGGTFAANYYRQHQAPWQDPYLPIRQQKQDPTGHNPEWTKSYYSQQLVPHQSDVQGRGLPQTTKRGMVSHYNRVNPQQPAPQQSWNSTESEVWNEYHNPARNSHDFFVEVPNPATRLQPQSGMAYLQQEMANAVENAIANPRSIVVASVAKPHRPLPRIPLQPAPVRVPKEEANPESAVPPRRGVAATPNRDAYVTLSQQPMHPIRQSATFPAPSRPRMAQSYTPSAWNTHPHQLTNPSGARKYPNSMAVTPPHGNLSRLEPNNKSF